MRRSGARYCAAGLAMLVVLMVLGGCGKRGDEALDEHVAPAPPGPTTSAKANAAPSPGSATDGQAAATDDQASAPTSPGAMDTPPPLPDVTLTKELLDKWVASMGDRSIQAAIASTQPKGKAGLKEMAASADAQAGEPVIDMMCKRYGFSGAPEWAATTKRIFIGLMTIEIDHEREQLERAADGAEEKDPVAAAMEGRHKELADAFGTITPAEQALVAASADRLRRPVPEPPSAQ
jgi:hypothetical protein